MGFMDAIRTVTTPLKSRSNARRAYMASTDVFTVQLAGNLKATLANPVGSGRVIVLDHFEGQSLAGGLLRASVIINPTSGLPTTPVKVTNLRPGLNPAVNECVGQVKLSTDTTPLAGYDTGHKVVVDGNSYETPFHLDEGVTMGINIPLLVGAAGVFTVFWWEMET